jgi:hypothetical protein
MEFKFKSGRTITIEPIIHTFDNRGGQTVAGSSAVRVKAIGLGDYTERLLKSIGVTPERYVAAKAFAGLAPTCNCAARKEWLNKVGEWWASLSP